MKWGYESEVHKIRTFADLRNHADPAILPIWLQLALGLPKACTRPSAFTLDFHLIIKRRQASA